MGGTPLYPLALGSATALVLLGLSALAFRLLAGTAQRTVARRNPAQALSLAGYVFGVFLITGAVVMGSAQGDSLGADALWVGTFSASAVLLLIATGRLGLRLLVRSRLPAELDRGNLAAGVVAAAHYVATSILIASLWYGRGARTLGIAVVFFLLAQVTLHLLLFLFRAITPYSDSEEILDQNVAAALSYAGAAVALGLLIGHAVEGDFVSWRHSLAAYAGALLFGLALYPIRQFVIQTVLLGGGMALRGGRLDQGIAAERNVGLGALEAVSYVATALFVLAVIS
jgi:uncharacterized membrane protein YjfL (UPF0719 family)